jgi:tRNA A-37 threonylcarbamoyl transferase component Bud32
MITNLLRKLNGYLHPCRLPTVRAGGRVWHFTPAGAELFGPQGPQPERWAADGTAVVVKANPGRTVYRVELPGGTVFLKHCRVNGPRALGREIIRPPKARMEFENALTLRDRGVPAVEPLAWGAPDSVWPGESFLITRGLAAVPFLDYLEHVLAAMPPGEQRAARRHLASELAWFLARLHDAGIAHPDPHPGNMLVETAGGPRFALIDLHDVEIGPPLTWAQSRQNLALFNRWFQLRAARPDRARFWHAYRRSRVSLPPPTLAEARDRAREVEAETHESNLRLWAGREPRWVGSNRSIRKVRRGPVRGFAVRDLLADFLDDLLADPDAAFARPHARLLKDCPTATVAMLAMPTPGGPVPVVLKRVNVRSWADPLKNLVRRSHVVRSWANGHALRDRRLPTPRPLAVFHRYRGGVPLEGYLLTEAVPGAVGLDRVAQVGADPQLPERLARVLRTMHDRGVSHRDLKAPNILLERGADPVLIDLVGVRTRVRLTPGRRAKELARLNASFAASPAVTRGDRLRFLRAYLRIGPRLPAPAGAAGGGADWKAWWAAISRATAAKVARNRRAGRVLG